MTFSIVDDVIQASNYDLTNIFTPIKGENFANLLRMSNYNPQKIEFIEQGFSRGFNLEYQGPREVKYEAPNLPFVVGDRIELWNKVMQEVQMGRYAGPYKDPPFEHYIQSPIGLVPKDGGQKTRLIFHLSYPRSTQRSVNINTPRDLCTVKYKDFDYAIQLCIRHGAYCNLAKSDLISAFRHLCVRPEDWPLLVMKAVNPLDNLTYYFVDKCLPFGHAISCSLFQEISNAISHIVSFQSGRPNVNYLDDFLFIAALRAACNGDMKLFIEICQEIGFPVSDDKTIWASTCISFLGLLINSARQVVCIPVDKIEKIKQIITGLLTRKKMTLRELQQICGHLNFVCKCVGPR